MPYTTWIGCEGEELVGADLGVQGGYPVDGNDHAITDVDEGDLSSGTHWYKKSAINITHGSKEIVYLNYKSDIECSRLIYCHKIYKLYFAFN